MKNNSVRKDKSSPLSLATIDVGLVFILDWNRKKKKKTFFKLQYVSQTYGILNAKIRVFVIRIPKK